MWGEYTLSYKNNGHLQDGAWILSAAQITCITQPRCCTHTTVNITIWNLTISWSYTFVRFQLNKHFFPRSCTAQEFFSCWLTAWAILVSPRMNGSVKLISLTLMKLSSQICWGAALLSLFHSVSPKHLCRFSPGIVEVEEWNTTRTLWGWLGGVGGGESPVMRGKDATTRQRADGCSQGWQLGGVSLTERLQIQLRQFDETVPPYMHRWPVRVSSSSTNNSHLFSLWFFEI